MSWHLRTIGEAVGEELSRFGRPGDLADVVEAWPDAVGAAIAENAWPARIARDGTLSVSTSSSVWAFELTKLEATIRERLATALGEKAPDRLRFAVGRLPAPRPDAKEVLQSTPKVTEAERSRAAALTSGIEDEELRELVLRAAAASLARTRATPGSRPPQAFSPGSADRLLWYTSSCPESPCEQGFFYE